MTVQPKLMNAKTTQKRIFILDDHPILRAALGALITQENDLTVCGSESNARNAISSIQKAQADVVLLDISLDGANGLEVLKDIKVNFPKLKVLVLSMHDELAYAQRALRAGASGYVMKDEAPEIVLLALHKVLNNEVYVSPSLGARLLNRMVGNSPALSPMDALSDRELEVFSLVGKGFGTRAIAEMLHLSVKTIESHRAHIKEKLNLSNATELVHQAIQWGQSESSGRSVQKIDGVCLSA